MIRILDFAELTPAEVFSRSEPTTDVADIVTGIINDVIDNGDEALRDALAAGMGDGDLFDEAGR